MSDQVTCAHVVTTTKVGRAYRRAVEAEPRYYQSTGRERMKFTDLGMTTEAEQQHTPAYFAIVDRFKPGGALVLVPKYGPDVYHYECPWSQTVVLRRWDRVVTRWEAKHR